jgi:hypothetical protein
MQRLVLGLLALLVCAGVARAQDCAPMAGVQRLWANPQTRFVILGEYHGTTETPPFFVDIVCHALRTGRPVHVGLEFAEKEQAGLDRYFAGQDPAYVAAGAFDDGRHSLAMYAMISRLRQLRRGGRPLEVFAFLRDSQDGHNQTPHELAMASAWRDRAARHPDALIVILTGNIHAMKRRARGQPYVPAAALLPPESTLALRTTQPGGAIWACVDRCGPQPWPARGEALPRGVHLGSGDEAYDGRFSVGRPFTPSPPVAAATR